MVRKEHPRSFLDLSALQRELRYQIYWLSQRIILRLVSGTLRTKPNTFEF